MESMHVRIQRRNLDTGTGTNPGTREFARRLGSSNDHAGHLIASRLGGTGTETFNIIPQSPHMNTGAWRADVEDMVYSIAQLYGEVVFTVNPMYNAGSTRPYSIAHRISWHDGSHDREIIDDLLNPGH